MEIVAFVVIVSLACLLQAILGFGSALLATPLALLFLDKETVVSSMVVIGLSLNGYLSRRIRSPINSRLVLLLFAASLVGSPVGVWILKTIPIDLMKVLVGTLVVLFTLALYSGSLRLPNSRVLTVVAGFVSGLTNTSTSMGGPPVFLLLAGWNLPRDRFRRTLASFFLLMGVVSLALFIGSQIMTLRTASYGLASVPFVFLSGFAGDRLAAKVPQRPLRLLALGILLLVGLYSIFTGLL
jgi:uncharacterized membrane protein YfcA